MLSLEHDEQIPGACSHPGCQELASMRCQECSQPAPYCRTHILSAHRHLPYHWIEEWNSNYFERRDLGDIGLVLHLGHRGLSCPERPTGDTSVRFVIVHNNGVHTCRLQYCHCPHQPDCVSQLIRAGLFPASVDRIETAFTLDCLKSYHKLYDVGRVSAQDFVRYLLRLSNNADMYSVKVSYSNPFKVITFDKSTTGPLPSIPPRLQDIPLPHDDQEVWQTALDHAPEPRPGRPHGSLLYLPLAWS